MPEDWLPTAQIDRVLSILQDRWMPKLTAEALAFSELVLEVFRVNGLALEAGDALGEPSGLSSARWQVLGVVDHGAVPVSTIARTMGLTRQSVQLTANALELD